MWQASSCYVLPIHTDTIDLPPMHPNPDALLAPQTATLRLVYPSLLPENPALHEASTFLLGQLLPPADALELQLPSALKQTVRLGDNGFFAHKVALNEGDNTFTLQPNAGEALKVCLKRSPILRALEGAFHPEVLPHPQPCIVMAGQSLPLVCLAPKGTWQVEAELWLTRTLEHLGVEFLGESLEPVGKALLSQPLTPSYWLEAACDDALEQKTEEPKTRKPEEAGFALRENRTACFAELHQQKQAVSLQDSFEGELQLPANLTLSDGDVLTVRLLAYDQEHQLLESWLSPTTLTYWAYPRLGKVLGKVLPQTGDSPNTAVLSHAETPHSKLPTLLPQTRVQLTGQQGQLWRLRYGEDLVFWAPVQGVEAMGIGQVPIQRLQALHIEQLAPLQEKLQLRLPLRFPVPYYVFCDLFQLGVVLYGVEDACDFIHQHLSTLPVAEISFEAFPNHWHILHVGFTRPICGYKLNWDGQKGLLLEPRFFPTDPSQWIIAIDPGHGGHENGALALDGTPEKHLNLQAAQLLKQALRQLGFNKVLLTRHFDEAVSLEERARRVAASGAHLCLSLHHNALPDGREPWEHEGASTYYFHFMSRALAQSVQQNVMSHASSPDYGVLFDNLAMTRLHTACSVLLEAGFLTHPEEGALLLESAYQQKLANAVAQGVSQFQTQLLESMPS